MNILIVDDVIENVILLKRILARHGWTNIFSATSALQAYEVLEKKSIDIIYLDIIMPEIDGIEACKYIRSRKEWVETPIIMITANDERESIKEAFAAGANDYVRKPVDLVELMTRTNSIVKMKNEIDARVKRETELENELMLAKSLQTSLLTPLIENEMISAETYYEPSDNVGGDMYSVYEIGQGEYGVLIYDVMGHGIASALVSMSLYSLTHGLVTKLKYPKDVICELNSQMHRLFHQNPNIEGYFITTIYLYINTNTREIQYVNAGHPEAFSFQKDRINILSSTTPFLGVLPNIDIVVEKYRYEKGERLFLYTDGLIEHIHPNKSINPNEIHTLIDSENDSIMDRFVEQYQLTKGRKLDDICVLTLLLK